MFSNPKKDAAMNKRIGYLLLCLALLLVSGLLSGCGSGGGTIAPSAILSGPTGRSETGTATVNVVWPARTGSRLIPVASNSLVVTLTFNGKVVATQTITKPATQAVFPYLPVGQLGVTVVATPDSNSNLPAGNGVPQASGTGRLTVQVNKTAVLNVTLQSTITSLQILPPSNNLFLPIGGTASLDVEALDSQGNMVLVSPQTIQWQTGGSVISVTRDPTMTGVTITGLKSGDTSITVFETESGRAATLRVSVRGPLASVKITSIQPMISLGGIMQFSVVAMDAGGFMIPGGNVPGLAWSSSNPQVAVINAASGLCQGNSAGPQGSQFATAVITVTAGTFSDTSTITVNAGTGAGPPLLSPSSVTVIHNSVQVFEVWQGQSRINNVPWRVDDPTNLGPAVLGSIDGRGNYTAPATPPSANGLPLTITIFGGPLKASVTVQ